MNQKCCIFISALDLTAGSLITKCPSGVPAELFVLAEANKQLKKKTNRIYIFFNTV